ncbi:MAG: hypothetical protein E7666_04495 [Ruminococcaceae bacterium]|nr:hypothetical protein [Oscillospiraceae bacterium]
MTARFIKSYIPEPLALKDKKGHPARLCREDFLILDGACPERILASRVGSLSQDLSFTKEDLSFLRAQKSSQRVLMLGREDDPILVFGDLLADAEVLVAILPHLPARVLLAALSAHACAPQFDLICSPALSALTPAEVTNAESVSELLDEWLYYRSRICSKNAAVGIVQRCLLISQFAGFQITPTDLPQMPLHLSLSDQLCFAAFFLCVLLSFRTANARLFTDTETALSAALSVTLGESAGKGGQPIAKLPFLTHAPFKAFGVSWGDDGIRFELGQMREGDRLSLRQSETEAPILQFLLRIGTFYTK